MADDLSTYWKNKPSRETPLDARTLNGWGALIEEQVDAAGASAQQAQSAATGAAAAVRAQVDAAASSARAARDEAVAHADLLAAPAIEQVAGYVNGVGGLSVQTALDRFVNRTARRQAQLLGEAMRRLAYNEALTITCQGDSLTYGYDLNSPDKVAANPTPAGDGAAHAFTRSPSPWPTVFGNRLNDAHSSTITVLNRGFSGDTVENGFTRWPATSGAHVTVFMYGQNDAVGIGVERFIDGYERLILREINERNAAVVIFTPPRALAAAAGRPAVEGLRNAIGLLADRYSVPVIDTEDFFSGFDSRTHSDSVHFNTFGNNIFGSRAAAAFIGMGPHRPMSVMHGSKLSVRTMTDNLVVRTNAAVAYTLATETAPDGGASTGQGIDLRLGGSNTLGWATYSFYTETPDLVVIPYYVIGGGAALQIQLDYNIEQGDAINDLMVGDVASTTTREPGQIQRTSGGSAITQASHATGASVIRIVNTGWHTLRLWGGGTGTTNDVRIRGLEFMDYTSLRVAQAAGL